MYQLIITTEERTIKPMQLSCLDSVIIAMELASRVFNVKSFSFEVL